MDLTHVHLLINHVAVIGAFLGMVVLVFAMRSKSKSTYYAAYTLLIMAALGAGIAYNTGESAEETVEGIAGVSEATIDPHEDAAGFALATFAVLGVLAAAGAYISYAKETLQAKWSMLMLVVSLVSFVAVSRTAWLGGKIRHTEITAGVTQGQGQPEGDEEEDD